LRIENPGGDDGGGDAADDDCEDLLVLEPGFSSPRLG
jgi:hypothetical protein